MGDKLVLEVESRNDADARLWATLHEVCEHFAGLPWVLVGGLMVRLLEAEHGRESQVATIDVDALIDVRAMTSGTREAAQRLLDRGFRPERPDGETVYRFTRSGDIVDVLAPEGLGSRADIVTVPPASTFRAVGGSRALRGRRRLAVKVGTKQFEVPVPDLAGAIVIKARAATSTTTSTAKHERDLARLLALVDHPYEMRESMSGKERGYVRRHHALADPGHAAWAQVADADLGSQNLAVICG
jgi:hypothetical protein